MYLQVMGLQTAAAQSFLAQVADGFYHG